MAYESEGGEFLMEVVVFRGNVRRIGRRQHIIKWGLCKTSNEQ